MLSPSIQILQLLISTGHNFLGRGGRPAGTYPQIEVPEMRLFLGRGIEGDRYLDHKANYKGQITFFDDAVYQRICDRLNVRDKGADVFRRNVITSGFDLNDLIGKEFEIQGIQFFGTEECAPCVWMNRVFAPGAHEALKGYGGLRARILTDGILKRSALPSEDQIH